MFGSPRTDVAHHGKNDLFRILETPPTAKFQVHPAGRTFREQVAGSPTERFRRQVNIAEMGQADGR